MNLLKNSVSLFLLIPTLYFVEGSFSLAIERTDLFLLIFSGALGIGVADACVLKSLGQIGATRLAIVETCYSPMIVLLSIFYLGEQFTLQRGLGMALVVGALILVNVQKIPSSEHVQRIGIFWGTFGIFAMAIGIVLVKPVFDNVALFWVITIRVAAGVIASIFVWLASTNFRQELKLLLRAPKKVHLGVACVLSTYISMIMWVGGFKFNDAIVTAVLNQMTTVFTVLLAAVVLHERLTPIKIIGTILAMTGAFLVAF
jgi:drug/metabolite transporter (DMT)-like permease